MVKFDYIKKVPVIPYVKPKIFWTPNKGILVGRNMREMYRWKIASFKRYFAS